MFPWRLLEANTSDRPVCAAGDPLPLAAILAVPPRRREATVLREPREEPEKAALLLLCAGADGGHQRDEQDKSKTKGRHW